MLCVDGGCTAVTPRESETPRFGTSDPVPREIRCKLCAISCMDVWMAPPFDPDRGDWCGYVVEGSCDGRGRPGVVPWLGGRETDGSSRDLPSMYHASWTG